MGINHITLMGTVVRGPEFRMTQSGHPTLSFTVQVPRQPRQDGSPSGSDFVRVIAWRNLAERLKDSLHKDALVVVEGRLTTRSYDTPDGQRRKVIEVEANSASPVGAVASAPASAPYDGPEAPVYDDFSDLEAAPPPPAATKSFGQRPAAGPAPRPQAPAQAAPPPDDYDEIPF